MLRMQKESKEFLEENFSRDVIEWPLNRVLHELYDLIEGKGFLPPNYDEYNDFGRIAQKVYDDIFLSN